MHPVVEAILTTRPIEDILGWALSDKKHNDAGLITRNPAFSSVPSTISVTSPLGPSGSTLPKEYSSRKIGGLNLFPTLSWSAPNGLQSRIKEWVVVSEDPDAPMPEPIIHGIYFDIDAAKTELEHEDLKADIMEEKRCEGGFSYGANRRKEVYIAPRPIARHGEHRYIFSVLGLGKRIDWTNVEQEAGEGGVGKEELIKAVQGKVLSRGEWIGVFERK